MSRDLTPEECYLISLEIDKDFTLIESIKWHVGDKVFPLYPDEEIALMKKHQYLGRTAPSVLSLLFNSNEIYLIELLDDEIRNIVEHGKADETIVKWFRGVLDPSFYYSETNNELLMDYLHKKFN